MKEKMFLNVDDVCEILEISQTTAYKIMAEFNKELAHKGYMVFPGKIPVKFFSEKVYGFGAE